MKRITDTQSFIERSKETYGDLFDYDKTIYTTWRSPSILKCKKCGEYFNVTPAKHLGVLKKRPKYGIVGCPKCNYNNGIEQRRIKNYRNWLEKSIKKHKNNFEYSKVVYIDNDTPVEIFCKKCGEYFWQSPLDHLRSPFDYCPRCIQKRTNIEQSIGLDEFIKRSNEIYGIGRFDFSKTKYINSHSYVRILDIENNVDFLITPQKFLSGSTYELTTISFGEKIIKYWLDNNTIYFGKETSYKFYNKSVRIDFTINYNNKRI